uniref:glycosyl hydrolase 115 family protein n=1 Tax=Pedobacter sp. TaxID=1411316 RepID=UPI003D7FDD41
MCLTPKNTVLSKPRLFQQLFITLSCSFFIQTAFAQDFTIAAKNTKTSIVYSKKGPLLDSISAYLLQQDIYRVTHQLPVVVTALSKATANAIIIGNIDGDLMRMLLPIGSSLKKEVTGGWESFGLKVLQQPVQNIKNALLIAGSDSRGTAYGVFHVSEKIGVSPWYWWADVAIKTQSTLKLTAVDYISSSPSVKYRGVFINDEDWGLQPWAQNTFEPETGDIGPKTYAKVFELLLRLKANLIWPAMHPSTKAFYHYADNKKVAAAYAIVIGSSHAEPMLRNNVGEWDASKGDFNYITNKDRVYNYWDQRVKESSINDAIYSLGMRGVHDSGIEGVKKTEDIVPLLTQIFKDQRGILEKHIPKNITTIPQAFVVYKEVLDIYNAGLKVPEDVTLVWPDDNYGYIQRLNNTEDSKRNGGSGVYYHGSYWGRPHDYLWLSTTHPGLIREEMMKAYNMKSDR